MRGGNSPVTVETDMEYYYKLDNEAMRRRLRGKFKLFWDNKGKRLTNSNSPSLSPQDELLIRNKIVTRL